MNDSSTGGYLSPGVATPPEEDLDLDRLMVQMVVGISGLPPSLVRPRWQPTTPKQPEPTITWAAIGISSQTPDDSPAIVHSGDNGGSDTYLRHERIELMCSFYGPQAKQYAQQLADGIAIPQNREALQANDMAFVGVGDIRAAPELVNQLWIRRYDMVLTLRRKITRTYAVLNIESLSGDLTVDGSQPLDVPLSVTPS